MKMKKFMLMLLMFTAKNLCSQVVIQFNSNIELSKGRIFKHDIEPLEFMIPNLATADTSNIQRTNNFFIQERRI